MRRAGEEDHGDEARDINAGAPRPPSSSGPPPSPRMEKCMAKAEAIQEACQWKDLTNLRALATAEGGLLSDELRRQACRYHQRHQVRALADKYPQGLCCLAIPLPLPT